MTVPAPPRRVTVGDPAPLAHRYAIGDSEGEALMRQVVQLWFVGTALFLSAAMIWAFVPVLIPALGVTAGLGVIVAGMVSIARWIERHRAG